MTAEGTAAPPKAGPPPERSQLATLKAVVRAIRRRIFSGLFFALPIAVTIWVVYQLYFFFQVWVLNPGARLTRWLVGSENMLSLPTWWQQFVSPFSALVLAGVGLYILGYLGRSRMHRAIDWVMLHLPIVEPIYKAVRNLVRGLDAPAAGSGYKRVVLVEFPHPGMKALAFVTSSLRDADTGRTILSLCILTGVMPPQGFTLFVPEEDVVDVDWSVNDTLQAILSGGITAPPTLRYGRPKLILPGDPPVPPPPTGLIDHGLAPEPRSVDAAGR